MSIKLTRAQIEKAVEATYLERLADPGVPPDVVITETQSVFAARIGRLSTGIGGLQMFWKKTPATFLKVMYNGVILNKEQMQELQKRVLEYTK